MKNEKLKIMFFFILHSSFFIYISVNIAFASDECRDCHEMETQSFVRTAHSKNKDCDICHGSQQKHLSQEGKKDNIDNPADLNLKKSNDLCLLCHEEKGAGGKFLPAANLHESQRCYECHAAHLKTNDEADELDLFRSDLSVDCAACHGEWADSFASSSHASAGLVCSECHKLHEEKTISRDIEGEIDKCLSCHPSQELEFKSAYPHPLRERQIKCADCHNPHSNDYDKMLKYELEDLCADCHAGIVIEGGKHPLSKNTDHPFKTINCLDCHRGHGSNFDKLLKHNIDNICKTCHN